MIVCFLFFFLLLPLDNLHLSAANGELTCFEMFLIWCLWFLEYKPSINLSPTECVFNFYFPSHTSYSSAALQFNVMKQKDDFIEWVVCTVAICCFYICNATEKVWWAFSPEVFQVCQVNFCLNYSRSIVQCVVNVWKVSGLAETDLISMLNLGDYLQELSTY